MEIKNLQRLIKQQSNLITHLETFISLGKDNYRAYKAMGLHGQAQGSVEAVKVLKKKLKQCVEIQKDLKKEIYYEMETIRFHKQYIIDECFEM